MSSPPAADRRAASSPSTTTTVTDLGIKPKGGTQDYVKLAKIGVDESPH